MQQKYLMIANSVLTTIIGLATLFFPAEILSNAGVSSNKLLLVFIQVFGACYIGFALMNWMAKTVLIGGIYAKPLAMGNFAHFMIAGISLLKAALNASLPGYLWILVAIYMLFAILFGVVAFTAPRKKG